MRWILGLIFILYSLTAFSQDKSDSIPTLIPETTDSISVLKPETRSNMPTADPDSIISPDDSLQKIEAQSKTQHREKILNEKRQEAAKREKELLDYEY
ncbi:MAG TPA: hypothetical protein VIK89_12445 [Cytophagaceae bacterium]